MTPPSAERARHEALLREEAADEDAEALAAEDRAWAPRAGTDDVIDVVVDVPIRSPLNGQHSGWLAVSARRRVERRAFEDAVGGLVAPVWDRYFVTLERVGANPMDTDNLAAGFKTIRDAVARWLRLDDADDRIVWSYAQRVERVRDDTPRTKHAWRAWCRVVVAPTAELAGVVDDGVESIAPSPDKDARRILPCTRGSRPAPPELPNGDHVRTIELGRRDGKSSRLVASLRVLLKPSGRGTSLPAGARFVRLSINWETAGPTPWRTVGTVVRMDEIDPLVAALLALKDEALT
ncbi:MAG TPA: hypothetical protein VGM56_08700 [Byssovorax sp.]|jgi:hypothetical protein